MLSQNPITPTSLTIAESSDLDYANDDGTVTVPAGEERIICEFRPMGSDLFDVLAVGATDNAQCRYVLRSGSEVVTTTESPLGKVNAPFSFTNEYGRPLRVNRYVTYSVINEDTADKDFVGRLHCEVP